MRFQLQVNHFPGAFHLGRKDRLWLHLYDMMQRFPGDEFCIMPFTYILPRDSKKLRAYLTMQTIRHVILKPVPIFKHNSTQTL
jgi:hypothetical protein